MFCPLILQKSLIYIMNTKQKEDTFFSNSNQKKAYHSPGILFFGKISQLTQAGSGTFSENGNPGSCSQEKNNRPCGPSP